MESRKHVPTLFLSLAFVCYLSLVDVLAMYPWER